MNYREAIAWLYSTQGFGIKLGLDNTRRLIALSPCPADVARRARILHVAGTNGKGSVCAMLDSIARAAGYRVGLYTSPHLVTFRERIRIDGKMIPEQAAAAALTRLRDAVQEWEHPPTFFELATALALEWFYRQEAEIIVLETGMGGRLDSTNALTPAVAVLTPIGIDHAQYLGNTLEAIAGEKAGIIKPGVPVVSALQEEPAARVISETASRLGAPLTWATEPVSHEVALAGSHQKLNAALALESLQAAGIAVPGEAVERGLRKVVWPGRFQRIPRPSGVTMILDGAHNEAAAAQLGRTWREEYGALKPVIVFSGLADKDLSAVCTNLAAFGAEFVVTPVPNPRSCTAEQLARVVAQQAPGVPTIAAASTKEALQIGEARAAQQGAPLLVTGSLFLVGEALAIAEGLSNEFVSVQ